MSGGFGGGLAQGIASGVQLSNQKKYYDARIAQDDQEHKWKQEDRDKEANKELETWDNVNKILTFRTDGSAAPMQQAGTQQPVMMDAGFGGIPVPDSNGKTFNRGFANGGLISLQPKGYAQGGMIPPEVFNGGGAGAYQAGSLASPQQQAPAQAAPAAPPPEQLDPKQELMKQMMNGTLANDPDKLSAIHAAFEQGGMGKTMGPWLERAYKAKKSGMVDGAMQLMRGQVDEAIDSLARGGIKLEDRPVQVDPKNPRIWKINISGSGEREMDIGDLLQTTMDPDAFLKHQNDTAESQGKQNVSASTVRRNDSEINVDRARIGKLGEETRTIRDERAEAKANGGLSNRDLSKLPAPVATAQWLVEKGVYPDHKTAFNAVKTLNDKSPAAARMDLVQSIMKGGMATPEEAIAQADQVMGAMGIGGNTPGATTPPPSAIRKFNPKTGKFD